MRPVTVIPVVIPPVPTARTGRDRPDKVIDLSCGDGSGGTQWTGLSALLNPHDGGSNPSGRTVFAAQQPCTLVPRAASPRLVIPLGSSWTTTAKGDTAVVLVYEELTEPERAVWDAIEADGLVSCRSARGE